jgi:hypothetical protein
MAGFSAIPDLIDLLDDRRLTVHETPAFTRAPARIRRIGELAENLLQEITGQHPHEDGFGDKADAWRGWWETARNTDPEKFFASAVFQRDEIRIVGVNESPARILAQHFPQRLRQLCEDFCHGTAASALPFALAEAVAVSTLPKQTRVELLSAFAERGSLDDRRCALQNLAKVDSAEASRILKPLLEQIPYDVTGPYWTCPEANFSHVVMEIEDDDIWREWCRVAGRSSVGLRLEMLEPLNYAYIGEKNRSRRLAILAAFLDDASQRTMAGQDEKYDGPCAAFTFPQIEVRNFAADKIASILGLEDDPNESWTAVEWAALRSKVRDRLAAETLPALGE